jgi:pantoate--beta-alanine ligase
MMTVRTIADLRAALDEPRRRTAIGFVPTMGALHAGHAALVTAARAECGHVVASIFVNPAQFNDPADLAAYPRQESEDARIAVEAGVDTLFVPDASQVFPAGHATRVVVGGVAHGFEGDQRPGHFDGVALVCLKLFGMTQPERVYFGQKDAQQVAVVRQMVRDLDVPVVIRVVPTVRDEDGLALSSRNVRLSPDERARALALPGALRAGLDAHRQGTDPRTPARAALAQAAGLEVEYVEVAPFEAGPTLVIAARVGAIRLIDNVPLDRPELAGLTESASRL